MQGAIALHRAYLDEYGTTQGFFRFIDEGLSPESRAALLYSVKVWRLDTGDEVQEDVLKKRFLFALRNAFTHYGQTHGSHARAMMHL